LTHPGTAAGGRLLLPRQRQKLVLLQVVGKARSGNLYLLGDPDKASNTRLPHSTAHCHDWPRVPSLQTAPGVRNFRVSGWMDFMVSSLK
jgi:hypothetical protein